ncbi:MAG: hypothetical protein KJ904_02780 [Alphaproteobacteria bacterium]|nr:hypothetical protein [Alphaproteobacteria bacterium]MBU0798799.1 hypothetical protein [Alphaproteobacteria bacterium]MBU0886062.1 hypothetical protein [Alphaproteobacteria bacterium]MBU1812051.1 hypothetical protein [Alphaproteobacteria bacterium]MBU2089225.1 hypothetical protein [Alphaproteobacteria bacterium]
MTDKAARLAEALRQNLMKRKQQARGRTAERAAGEQTKAAEPDAEGRKKATETEDDTLVG